MHILFSLRSWNHEPKMNSDGKKVLSCAGPQCSLAESQAACSTKPPRLDGTLVSYCVRHTNTHTYMWKVQFSSLECMWLYWVYVLSGFACCVAQLRYYNLRIFVNQFNYLTISLTARQLHANYNNTPNLSFFTFQHHSHSWLFLVLLSAVFLQLCNQHRASFMKCLHTLGLFWKHERRNKGTEVTRTSLTSTIIKVFSACHSGTSLKPSMWNPLRDGFLFKKKVRSKTLKRKVPHVSLMYPEQEFGGHML